MTAPSPAPGTLRLAAAPRISIAIPHWQVRDMMALCLRSIRRHSARYDLEVIVIDNGSRDDSLAWLRSLPWIRLIERPEETPANWPRNVFTAWDVAARQATGEYFVTMHSDVFVRRDDWLDPLLAEFDRGPQVAASGAWKLALEHPLYAWQKQVLGTLLATVKGWLRGRRQRVSWKTGHYPRDYCAMYRRDLLIEHDLSFCPGTELITGGYPIARQLWERGFETAVIPLHAMAARVVHMTHGSAALTGKALRHKGAQSKAERRAAALLSQSWLQELRTAEHLDAA